MNNLIIITIFGSLLLLSFLMFINPLKVNVKANLFFGLFTLLWASFWLEEILDMTMQFHEGPVFITLLTYIQTHTPVFCYLSVVFFTNPAYRFRISDVKFLALPLFILVLLIEQEKIRSVIPGIFQQGLTTIILMHGMFYVIISLLRINRHQKRILHHSSDTSGINLNWLEYIFFFLTVIFVSVTVYNILFPDNRPSILMNAIFLVAVFSVAFNALKQKEIFPYSVKYTSEIISLESENNFGDNKRKVVPDKELPQLQKKLIRLMQEKKPYTDSELNLIKLAEMLEISPHQLSYVINQGLKENFFHFINRYRVEKAKELLSRENMNSYSILGIAFESGFNSKTAFNSTFKKITNLTPSEFKKKRAGL